MIYVCNTCNQEVRQRLMFCPKCGGNNFLDKNTIMQTSQSLKTNASSTQIQSHVIPNPNNHASIQSRVYPWRRYFARVFDQIFFNIIISFTITYIFPELYFLVKALSIFLLILFIPIEAFCLYAFKTTLGKFIYQINIEKRPINHMKFSECLVRSSYVWFFGLGIGFPIISIFTLVNSYSYLKKNLETSWDMKLGWRVSYNDISILRWFLIALCWIGVLLSYFSFFVRF